MDVEQSLVERLRSVDISWSETGEWCAEAAAEIERLTAENEKLRGALGKVLSGDVPRERYIPHRDDGKPSRYDQCQHGLTMREDCPNCIDLFIATALDDTIDLPRLARTSSCATTSSISGRL